MVFFTSTDVCRPGWNYFGGYCYFTSPACASWLTAESNCSAMNSDLVTVHNQQENVYIQHQHNGDKSWIGLNDRSVEGSFVWTNKEISSFRYWAPKQPNDWNNEDCVHTLGAKHGYTWNDVPCNNCFNFTCFTGDISLVNMVLIDHFVTFCGAHSSILEDALRFNFLKLSLFVFYLNIGKHRLYLELRYCFAFVPCF